MFQNIFHCCSDSKKRESIKDVSVVQTVLDKKTNQDENHNVNNIVRTAINKYDQDNTTKNISNQSNNHNNINVSIITFANIKVGESYKTLPEFDIEVMNSHELKHKSLFSLEYDNSAEHFILKALNKEINILHLINYNYVISENSQKKFLIGKIPVEISTNETKENSERVDSKTAIKVKNKDEWITYEYNVSDAPITIGRSHSSININNNSLSKEHAVIEFSYELNSYYIKDMNGTNGTFLTMEEKDSIQIVNEMKFKILETKFSISEVEQ